MATSESILDALSRVIEAQLELEHFARTASDLVADATDPPAWVHSVLVLSRRTSDAAEALEALVRRGGGDA